MLGRSRLGRVGFTLVEGAVVFAVLAVLSGIVLLRISGSADPRNDSAAKASLVVFQDAQLVSLRAGTAPLDADDVAAVSSGSAVTFVETTSDNFDEVGVSVDGSLVTGVTRSGSDCWMLRLEFEPSPASPPSWWFLVEGVESCSPAAFGALVFPSDGSGQDPNSPTILG